MSEVQHTSINDAQAILRPLALSAAGLTGADVERAVKEARRQARRAARPLAFSDLERTLLRGRPRLSAEVKWRIAIHESGHAIAWTVTGAGQVQRLTTGTSGGQTDVLVDTNRVEDEALFDDYLCCFLAGRAAEMVVFGNVIAGSGGGLDSDLGKSTLHAVRMESELGMSKDAPLLYAPTTHLGQDFRLDPVLAHRVNARLEAAFDRAKVMMTDKMEALLALARELNARIIMEPDEIQAVLVAHLV